MGGRNFSGIRPASQDPYGDPADPQQTVLPASQDPYGDPADQTQGVLPASQDPYGDPANSMAAGVQNFLSRFGRRDYSPEEAQQHFEQLQGHPAFQQAQQEVLSQMPPEQFQQSAQQAAQQMPQEQRQSLVGDLLGALQNRGINLGQITSMLGMGSTSPQQMGPMDVSRLLGWAQQNQPDALHEAASNNPGFVKLLGNPVVQGILGNLAGRLLGR